MNRWIFFVVVISAFLVFGSTEVLSEEGLSQIEHLGKILYQDKDLSYNSTQSCKTCHHHVVGFADPTNSRDPYYTVVSTGADGVSKGGRNAPSSAYSGYSPPLAWEANINGYIGGMFWDGRATGLSSSLSDPLAEQAQGPPLNLVEMNMPDKEAVVQAVRDSTYTQLFYTVFGTGSLDDVNKAYDNIALAIAAYERSVEVQQFNSRFDEGVLTNKEMHGMALFSANCIKCHSITEGPNGEQPLFTNYSYENIGVPENPLLAGNPKDYGLGGFLESDYLSATPQIGDAQYQLQYGKFKVPTLRNIVLTAPYAHNGFFPTLNSIVNFHNTRDVGNWSPPEISANLNTDDVGDLGLTDEEVDDIIAFLTTLTDR
ncbi:MAG: cytochrome c peroxidase [Thermodesulfobacteriota bacterium]|nr:cytochrome c peroxidase [Thermodesulfobacteriota bacterium]